MGECVYQVDVAFAPCSVAMYSLIYVDCAGGCDDWIFYQGPDCMGGAYASYVEDDCALGIAAMPALTMQVGQQLTMDPLKNNPQASRVVVQNLAKSAAAFTGIIANPTNINADVDSLLASLDAVMAATGGATRAQRDVLTIAWRARNLAAAGNATGARGKIESVMKSWQAAHPNTDLAGWIDEALNRVEAAPDRPGCSIVPPSRVISIKKP